MFNLIQATDQLTNVNTKNIERTLQNLISYLRKKKAEEEDGFEEDVNYVLKRLTHGFISQRSAQIKTSYFVLTSLLKFASDLYPPDNVLNLSQTFITDQVNSFYEEPKKRIKFLYKGISLILSAIIQSSRINLLSDDNLLNVVTGFIEVPYHLYRARSTYIINNVIQHISTRENKDEMKKEILAKLKQYILLQPDKDELSLTELSILVTLFKCNFSMDSFMRKNSAKLNINTLVTLIKKKHANEIGFKQDKEDEGVLNNVFYLVEKMEWRDLFWLEMGNSFTLKNSITYCDSIMKSLSLDYPLKSIVSSELITSLIKSTLKESAKLTLIAMINKLADMEDENDKLELLDAFFQKDRGVMSRYKILAAPIRNLVIKADEAVLDKLAKILHTIVKDSSNLTIVLASITVLANIADSPKCSSKTSKKILKNFIKAIFGSELECSLTENESDTAAKIISHYKGSVRNILSRTEDCKLVSSLYSKTLSFIINAGQENDSNWAFLKAHKMNELLKDSLESENEELDSKHQHLIRITKASALRFLLSKSFNDNFITLPREIEDLKSILIKKIDNVEGMSALLKHLIEVIEGQENKPFACDRLIISLLTSNHENFDKGIEILMKFMEPQQLDLEDSFDSEIDEESDDDDEEEEEDENVYGDDEQEDDEDDKKIRKIAQRKFAKENNEPPIEIMDQISDSDVDTDKLEDGDFSFINENLSKAFKEVIEKRNVAKNDSKKKMLIFMRTSQILETLLLRGKFINAGNAILIFQTLLNCVNEIKSKSKDERVIRSMRLLLKLGKVKGVEDSLKNSEVKVINDFITDVLSQCNKSMKKEKRKCIVGCLKMFERCFIDPYLKKENIKSKYKKKLNELTEKIHEKTAKRVENPQKKRAKLN